MTTRVCVVRLHKPRGNSPMFGDIINLPLGIWQRTMLCEMEVNGLLHALATLTPRERSPDTHEKGG
jgi:hypothetical protein